MSSGSTVTSPMVVAGRTAKMRRSSGDMSYHPPATSVLTGGTGLGSRDRTIEVVRPMLEKEMPGFGELFRMLSYQEQVGTASILSRATAGSARGKLLISLPGSRAAVQLAMEKIILPEGAHALRELRR